MFAAEQLTQQIRVHSAMPYAILAGSGAYSDKAAVCKFSVERVSVGLPKTNLGLIVMAEIPIRAFISSLVALRKCDNLYQVLLLERTQTLIGEWCQIAGKIEEGETAWQAAIRELAEETGLSPERLYSADVCEQFYEPARDAITMAPVFVAFVCNETSVKLNYEHSAYRWTNFEEAIELVTFGGQRRVLRWIEDEFIKRPPSSHLQIALSSN